MNSQMQFSTVISPKAHPGYEPAPGDPDPFGPGGASEAFAEIKKRLRLVLACIGVGSALAVFAAIFLMPHYTAKALLIVNDSDVSDPRRADEGAIDMHVSLLTSRSHLDHVLAEIQKDPDLQGRFPRTADIDRRLKVIQELRSRLIGINFTAKSPQIAAKVANYVARLYVEGSQTTGDADALNLARGIARQIDDAESQLQSAQSDLRGLESGPAVEPAARDALSQRVDFWRQQIAQLKLQQDLTRRQEEIRKQRAALAPDVRLYALAQPPEQPSSIKPVFIIIPAVIASALFGIALAVLLGRLDQRVHDVAGLRRAFSVPCLGAVPPKPVQSRTSKGGSPDDHERALEAIAVSIFLAPNAGSQLLIMVSSVDQSPGCDFVFDLAVMASQLKRTLLVDLVNPADHISTDRRRLAADAHRQMPLDLSYISLVRDGTNLLSLAASGSLAERVKRLRNDYDWIILAAPPVNASPVSKVIAGMVDKIVLTVRAEATVYSDVAEAIKLLASPDEDWWRSRLHPPLAFVMTDLPKKKKVPMLRLPPLGRVGDHSPELTSRETSGGPPTSERPEPEEGVAPTKKNIFVAGASQ